MRKFKRVMMTTAAIGSISLTGAGVAQACDGEPPHTATGNAQSLECDQEFSSSPSLITLSVPVSVGGDSVSNIGNFCTLVGPRR